VAINPETSVDALSDEILANIDVVNIMSVLPGCEGQRFIAEALDKIKLIQAKIKRLGYNVDIEVDGDINLQNLKSILHAGANIIVSGRAIFEGNLVENIRDFKAEFAKPDQR